MTIDFPAAVGAAAFHRHGEVLVLFDQRSPIDLGPVQAIPVFANARVELLPGATLLHLVPPPGSAISLARAEPGWTVAALDVPQPRAALLPRLGQATLDIPAQQSANVVSMPDPLTGGTLLVGTLRRAGEAVVSPLRTTQFTLLPTEQGVVAVPLADGVTLRAVPDGFSLSLAGDMLAMTRNQIGGLGSVAVLTRRFEFPDLLPSELIRRIYNATAEAAVMPLLARGPKRRAAAVAMIGLGLGAEAEALLQVTAADDLRQAATADIIGLTGVAAILAGRPGDAGGIDDPRLSGTDEVELWRALRNAMQDPASPAAAAALASTASLLLTYPPPIRDRMLPPAVETMVRGGAVQAAKELLLQSPRLPSLELARAMLSEQQGDAKAALARYDTLAIGRDQFLASRAAVKAVDLRLATGELEPRQAAEAYDRLLYAWRGDWRELALRNKLAALRQTLGEWRPALALLRDSEALFPNQARDLHARLQATFDALLHDEAAERLPPLEFVALVDENADLVPNTERGEAMQVRLADRLLALDLPKRAGPLLDKLMRGAPPGTSRATFGARLAALRLREGDAGGALAALTASDSTNLPPPLAEQRVLLRADGQARWGDLAGALGTLAGSPSLAADELRATVLERAKDWPAADRALADYVAKTVPESGELDDAARRTLLRLATAAARAGDEATLAALRARQEPRMGGGPLADLFRLLTADPVHDTADLPRAGREVGYARALPVDLEKMPQASATP